MNFSSNSVKVLPFRTRLHIPNRFVRLMNPPNQQKNSTLVLNSINNLHRI